MELRNLTTFVRAAELRSFSQTARQLGYSQSAISMQISQLEAELETCLFDRVGKTVTLTPQGLRFFEYAQNILRMTENARSVMKNASLISGQLRVAMAESVCMSIFPRVLERYCRLYPEVQLSVISGTAVDLPRALAQNDAQLQMPIVTPISTETWNVKEAMLSEEEAPEWGNVEERGIEMEITTAAACLTSSSDVVIMKHPAAIKTIAQFIDSLM